MKQMSLSQVCRKYGFTRRVLQGYEKEGLVVHTGKNKYGYLMYSEQQVKQIAFIRYLQKNGFTLKEILPYLSGSFLQISSALEKGNCFHQREIRRLSELMKKNEEILEICSKDENEESKEKDIFKVIEEELRNDKTDQRNR